MDKEPEFFYRLGDMIISFTQRNLPGGAKWHLKKFPDSIASKYLELPQTADQLNIEGLVGIITEFPPNIKPEDDELVVHLRVGDIMDHNHNEHIKKSKPLSFYSGLNLKKLNISKVTLLIGSIDHNCNQNYEWMKNGNRYKSLKYVDEVKKIFQEFGYETYLRRGFSADEDFVFACRAKMFIPSNSGFAIVIEEVRKYLGYKLYS